MANQLFNELVKLAAVKAARDTWGHGGGIPVVGGRRGGGAGGGGTMWAGRHGYMGPHPAMVPGMRERQQVQNEAYRQMLPREQQERAYAQRAGDLGTKEWRSSSEYDMLQRAEKNLAGLTLKDELAQKEYRDLNANLENARHAMQASREQLMNTPGGHSRLIMDEGTDGHIGNQLAAGIANFTRLGSAEHTAYTNAKAKYHGLRDSQIASAAGLAEMAQQRRADMNLGREQIRMQQETLADMSAQSRGDISHRAGVRTMPGQPGSPPMPPPDVSMKKVPRARPPRIDVSGTAPPPTHKPGGGLQHPPVIPIGSGPGGAPITVPPPLVPSASVRFLPTTLDQLVEGAARNMFDRYVKVAQAKIAIDTARNRSVATKPSSFTAGTSNKKDKSQTQTRSKKANSMGLDPAIAATMMGKADLGTGNSSVDLGPNVSTGRGGGLSSITQNYLPLVPGSDPAARQQMKALRAAHKANMPAVKAEQAAFVAKHGPPPGAGSQFFRSTFNVPVGKMAAARVLCLS